MITLEEARIIVAAKAASWFQPKFTFEVTHRGYENDDEYLIVAGTPGNLYGTPMDPDYLIGTPPVFTVNKHTGAYVEHFDLYGELPFPNMVPFGETP